MATTFVDSLSHIVFSTKHRQDLITSRVESELYQYMKSLASSLNCRCLAINGTENHTHMLVSLAKTLALSDFVRRLKACSSGWVKHQDRGANRAFQWQEGYGAFSVSRSNVPIVLDYIARQKLHHSRLSFEDEFRAMLRKSGLEFNEQYLFD